MQSAFEREEGGNPAFLDVVLERKEVRNLVGSVFRKKIGLDRSSIFIFVLSERTSKTNHLR